MVAHRNTTPNPWAYMQWKRQNDVATYDAVRDLFYVFSQVHDDETERAGAMDEPLRTLLGRQLLSANRDKSAGVLTQSCGRSTAYLIIQEVKDEIGEGSFVFC